MTTTVKSETEKVTISLNPSVELLSNYAPSEKAAVAMQKAIELFSIEENYVAAIKSIISAGFRVDLHNRKEWRLWPEPLRYKIGIYNPDEMPKKGAFTPFKTRYEPVKEYANTYVFKIEFMSEFEFENAMKAFYREIHQWGIVVMKAKKEQKPLTAYQELLNSAKGQNKKGKSILAESVKITHFKDKK